MSGSEEEEDNSASHSWPGFVDIMSSTIVVLCFALLVVVLVLTISKITSSTSDQSNEASPSAIRIESDVVGEYRAEFQKLAIIANPSLRKEMEIQSDQPTVDSDSKDKYVPQAVPSEEYEPVKEVGDSEKQVLGDIPKTVETRSVEVLKELILVQRDVIEQQRKVIEQQDDEVSRTVREYQSLLALVTKEDEVEDVRQKINPKEDIAKFFELDTEGNRLSGNKEESTGEGTYLLNPESISRAGIDVISTGSNMLFNFVDNASFLKKSDYDSIRNTLQSKIDEYKAGGGIVIESKMSDFALSGAEAQRIAVERLLVFRSLLVDLGLSPSLIKLKTVKPIEKVDNADVGREDESYGWVSIKKNS